MVKLKSKLSEFILLLWNKVRHLEGYKVNVVCGLKQVSCFAVVEYLNVYKVNE